MVLHWIPDSVDIEVSRINKGGVDYEKMRLTKSLLPQRNTLQLLQPILIRSTVNDRVLKERSLSSIVIHSRLVLGPTTHILLNLPRISTLAMH